MCSMIILFVSINAMHIFENEKCKVVLTRLLSIKINRLGNSLVTCTLM